MYHFDFKLDVDSEDMNEELFKLTNEYLEDKTKELSNDIFKNVSLDIEEYMYERFDNIQKRYFDDVVNFLLGTKYTHVRDEDKLEKWLQDLGYNQQEFRKRIYEENKDVITKQIVNDATYEYVRNMFRNYFKSWEFKDITINYPQSEVVRSFLNELIKQEGFNDEILKMLDNEIKDKLKELKYLDKRVSRKLNELESLEDEVYDYY